MKHCKYIKYTLTIALILGCILLLAAKQLRNNYVAAEDGTLNLESWNFDTDGTVTIDGDWAVYYSQLIYPEDELPAEPDFYHEVIGEFIGVELDGEELPRSGYATYRMIVKRSSGSESIGLKLGDTCSDYMLFANGECLVENGKVTTEFQETDGTYKPHIVHFDSDGNIELLVQASNFRQPNGQSWSRLIIGTEDQIYTVHEQQVIVESIIIGTSSLAFIIFAGIWIMLRNFLSSRLIYSAFFSLTIGLRSFVTGERIINSIAPDISFDLLLKLDHITFYMGVAFFLLVINSSFPGLINIKIKRIFVGIFHLATLAVILTPPRIFALILPYMRDITFVLCVYSVYIIIKASRERRNNAFEIGSICFFIVILGINDLLFVSGTINTGFFSPLGNYAFIFMSVFSIASSSYRKYVSTMQLSDEITHLNATLEQKVELRTRELRDMSIRDSMTKLYNHKYAFDYMEEMTVCYDLTGKTFSIAMFDIDYFKRVNDTYGHQSGDEVLVGLARYLCRSKRSMDIISRYGGEEFLLILPETKLNDAYLVAEKHRTAISQLEFANPEIAITVSVGIAEYSGEKVTQLVEHADKNLYTAKETGRNKTVL